MRRDQNRDPKVLIVTERNFHRYLARACCYEFEDIVHYLSNADIIAPRHEYRYHPPQKSSSIISDLREVVSIMLSRKVYLQKRQELQQYDFLFIKTQELQQQYDILFFVTRNLEGLSTINSLKYWREKSRYAVCWLYEVWINDLKNIEKTLPILNQFDSVHIGCSNTPAELGKHLSVECSYLPPGVDAMKFCPPSIRAPKPIDVYYMGRRSNIAHQSLLDYAKRTHKFYLYDTITAKVECPIFIDACEHRFLTSQLIQRSKFFIANKPQINNPDFTRNQEEVGFRFFEGAAGGTVMLGEKPRIPAFHENFDWPDAVINTPFNSTDLPDRIEELEKDNERVNQIRKNNIVNSLLRHDWVYRWENILEKLNIAKNERIQHRKKTLADRAKLIQNEKIG